VSWCVAFLVLALTITDTFLNNASMYYSSSRSPTLLAVLVGAGIPLIFRPRLAFGLLPAAAIFLGLYGFVVARDYGFWTHYVGNYAFLPVGDYNMRYYLVLPLAYGLLLLGGWLAWRVIDHESLLARVVLGRLANPASPSRLWAFLLLPVVFTAAMIFCPNIFFGSGLAGAVWTTASWRARSPSSGDRRPTPRAWPRPASSSSGRSACGLLAPTGTSACRSR
jgi:hypothetical protein